MPLAFLNVGTFELVVLAGAAILLFGGDLPDVARKAAVWVQKIRSLSTELSRELNRQVPPELKLPPDVKPRGLQMPDELKLTAKERAVDASWRPKSSPPGPEDQPPFGTREDAPPITDGAPVVGGDADADADTDAEDSAPHRSRESGEAQADATPSSEGVSDGQGSPGASS